MLPTSDFRYLADEVSLARSLGFQIPDPIRLFSLDDIGVNQARFLTELGPTFADLPWDSYDLKKSHVWFLKQCFPAQAQRVDDFHFAYHQDRATLDAVSDLLEGFTPQQREEFDLLEPYRRRSIAKFQISRPGNSAWTLQRVPAQPFAQEVNAEDIRSLKRIFAEAHENVTSHPEFQRFLLAVAELVAEARPSARELTATMHQVSIVADYDTHGDNAPEGIHKDGADYIVSALVVERQGILGGESIVYGPDKQTEYLRVELQPGQGIFQADQHSTLWHDITPIVLASRSPTDEGKRDIFGFDIDIVR